MLVRLIQCILLMKSDLGRFGSFFLMYKYSAICCIIPMLQS